MHNIKTNFDIIFDICKSIFKDDVFDDGNFYKYPNKPKMSDIQLVALSLTAESLSIDSENHLFNKLKQEYHDDFFVLIDRRNYNRRRKKLAGFISQLGAKVCNVISPNCAKFIVDSMPLAICKNARKNRSTICMDDPNCLPSTGYHAISKAYYFGYKMHIITSVDSVPVTVAITPANIADIDFLKFDENIDVSDCQLLGDKGYISESVQLSLFETKSIQLVTPLRANMKGQTKWSKSSAYHRKKIETKISQLDDQFMVKRNYAKTSDGLISRLTCKVAAVAALQFLNFSNKKSLNKLKTALAA
jgi:Transposase DDE domain